MKVTKWNNWTDERRVNISGEDDNPSSYYCNYCNHLLILTNREEKSYFCNTCEIESFPEKDSNRKKSKLITLNQNTETLISSIPSGYENYKVKKKVEYKGGIKALADKGLKITSYTEYRP